MPTWADFQGVNAAYVRDLYDERRRELGHVDPASRAALDELGPPPADGDADIALSVEGDRIARVRAFVEALRRHGHLAAQLDPLGSSPAGHPGLAPTSHGVTDAELDSLPAHAADADRGPTGALRPWIEALRQIYSTTTGYELDQVTSDEERAWWRDAVESGRYSAREDRPGRLAVLDLLSDVEAFERVLHRAFPGQTRFSVEGLDVLVPVLDRLVADAAAAGVRTMVVGMGHRGRLNVLAHLFQVPVTALLDEFREAPGPEAMAPAPSGAVCDGDVVYHRGGRRELGGVPPASLVLPPNPSHLEAVDPVVVGMVRAAGTAPSPGASFSPDAVLGMLVHGDAAFPGQGVVPETLNLARLAAYCTGGTIHLVANNQIGFTTGRDQGTSLRAATDLARGFGIPIVHVNADDVGACLSATRLVAAYRQQFHRDVVLDLVGYRRYGHNEGDEPSFTQPREYALIDAHPRVRERWARQLVEAGDLTAEDAQARLDRRMAALQAAVTQAAEAPALTPPPTPAAVPAEGTRPPLTLEVLRQLNAALLELPAGFTVHPKLIRARDRRRAALEQDDQPTVDWALAETLALGTIVTSGVPVRLTGQDSERGTFSQRHAVFHDVKTGQPFAPLASLPGAHAFCEIANSPLSENAALGFEYGYSVATPDRLVVWEAQYGDFVNGAQVVVDEFLVSGRTKWQQRSGLVLLLPHGLEGRGPDHASARPERWLQLAAEGEIRLVNCTTAAQYFHLLREQAAALATDPIPLVVFAPKSLLRHPLVTSRPRELIDGAFAPLLADPGTVGRPAAVRRVVFCAGKVGIELLASPRRRHAPTVAINRVEQLFPLPIEALDAELARYGQADEVVWIQEEPENMGAWDSVRVPLERLVGSRRLAVVARRRSASPSEGSPAETARLRARLLEAAFAGRPGTGAPAGAADQEGPRHGD